MKKIFITICAICLSLIASAQVNSTIKGKIDGVDGKKIYLYAAEGDRTVIDSTTVNHSSFIFKLNLPHESFACISIQKMGSVAILYIENGIINVNIPTEQGLSTICGTPTNDLIKSCNDKIDAFNDIFDSLRKQKNTLDKSRKNEIAAIEKKHEEYYNKRTEIIKECIYDNLGNVVGAYLLDRFEFILSDGEISDILSDASSAMSEHYFTKEVIKHQNTRKRTAAGQKYIDFTLKDVNDNEVSLSDYIGKGKYVLIDFWASWCSPCRGEIPHLKSAYEKYKSKGFEIVGVSMEVTKEHWLKGLEDLGVTWPQMSDLKGMQSISAKLYGVNLTGIPTTFLISPDGIIIARDLYGDAIEAKLSELLD